MGDLTQEQQATVERLKVLVAPIVAEAVAEAMRKAQEAATASFPDQIFAATAAQRKADVALEKGIGLSRALQAFAVAKGDRELAASIARKRWSGAEGDAIGKALSAGDQTAGGWFVFPDYQAEVIELLRAQAVFRQLNPIQVPMPQGTMSWPRLTGGATASYSGENNNIPSSQQATGGVRLTARKLVALVPISNDLLRFASVQTDRVVRDDMIGAVSTREDLAFIRGDGAVDTPLGLKGWTPSANVLTVNATVNLANVTSDLGRLMLQLMNADVRGLRYGWLFAPRTYMYLATVRDGNGNFAFRDEILRGQLWGFPFRMTTQIPINLAVTGTNESEIYFADFSDVVIGDAVNMQVDISSEAAYYDSSASAVASAFSKDQTVVRVIAEHDLLLRHTESVAYLSDVDWTP